ncbi:MAG: HAMP domain-containing sensor histidine kinase [Deltaproteobacteria bacterium]
MGTADKRDTQRESELAESHEEALYFITHELKNAVIAISGFAKRLMRTEEDPDRRQQLKIIYDQTKFLETVSARYLLSAQLQKGELEVSPEPIADFYDEVISPVIEVLSKGAPEPFEKAREQWEKRKPIEIMGDKNLLRVVYQNLLGNAMKYREPEGDISFGVQELEEGYQFNVWNNGPGVKSDETEKIFDKFYRGENGTARNSRGTGLGLYNVRQIIESHGGRIWCETRPGEWINFVFTLPKHQ